MAFVQPGTRVLVLALDGIGDLVLRQPLLSGLADAGADVNVLVQAGHEEMVGLVEPRARALAAALSWTRAPSAREFRELVTRLDAVAPQLLVSAQFDPVRYADWLVRAWPKVPAAGFEGGTIQEVAGCADLELELALPPRQLDVSVNCAPDQHEFTKASRLAERLTGQAWTRPRPVVQAGPEALESARALLAELGWSSGSYVACCPAGVKNVTLKAWPVERFAEVLTSLSRDRGLPALVMGHRAEGDLLNTVVTRVGAAGGQARTWLGSRGDLETLAALLGDARLYIGNDTGAMHIAAALGRPVVAVCGGGHWPRFLPLAVTGAAHTMPLPCFGCGWKDCFFGDGPCVTGVPSEAVFQSAAAVLNDGPAFSVKSAPLPPADWLWQKAVSTFRMATASRHGLAVRDRTAKPMLVSVVTPCLNSVRSIGQTLESVRAQKHPAIEHIVVDGGSTDGTLELLARAPGISWSTGSDAGMYDAINRGLRSAAGDILAYQNSDDVYAAPDAIALVVEAFDAHPEVDVLYGDFEYMDDDGNPLGLVRGRRFDLAALRRHNLVPPHSTFVRRRVVYDRGFWLDPSLRYAGDWDWFLRMALGGCTFLHVPHVLSRFRRRRSSLSATVGWRHKLAEWRTICRRTGTPLLPLILHESAWEPLRRRLRGKRVKGGPYFIA